MFQWIGRHLDTLLFLIVGAVCLVKARKVAAKTTKAEEQAKQKRLLQLGGTLLLAAGIGRLLL